MLIRNDYQSFRTHRCIPTFYYFNYLSLHVCYINFTVFILVLFSKMSKLTQLELIELLDGNISELSDFESESDEEIDELLANFDENENFELPDCPDYGFENINDVPEVDVSGWFTIDKNNMKWLQKPFRPPKVSLDDTEPFDCPDEIQNPIYYFYQL